MILATCEELNYRRNEIARGLRSGGVSVLGLLLGDPETLAIAEMTPGVVSAATECDRHVLVSFIGGRGRLEDELDSFIAYQCAGLILTTTVDKDRLALERLRESRVPFVLVIRDIAGMDVDFVGVDDFEGARLGAKHMIAHGYRDWAILSGPQASSSSRLRAEGYQSALAEARLRQKTVESELTMVGAYNLTTKLLAVNRPSAILCTSDVLALGAIDAVLDAGLNIPEDVAIAGYDDISTAASRRIALTTVRVPRRDLGRKAVELLVKRIAEPGRPPERILLPQRLMVRGTCGCR
jgi:DNA-binding LacI/PurR family transcriptional regulator